MVSIYTPGMQIPCHPTPPHAPLTSILLTSSPPNLLISFTTASLLTLISTFLPFSFSSSLTLTFTGTLFHPGFTFQLRWPVTTGFHSPTIASSVSGSQNQSTLSP